MVKCKICEQKDIIPCVLGVCWDCTKGIVEEKLEEER